MMLLRGLFWSIITGMWWWHQVCGGKTFLRLHVDFHCGLTTGADTGNVWMKKWSGEVGGSWRKLSLNHSMSVPDEKCQKAHHEIGAPPNAWMNFFRLSKINFLELNFQLQGSNALEVDCEVEVECALFYLREDSNFLQLQPIIFFSKCSQ